jgi:hypothetical protein
MQGTETLESQFIAVVVQKQKTCQNPLRFPFKIQSSATVFFPARPCYAFVLGSTPIFLATH